MGEEKSMRGGEEEGEEGKDSGRVNTEAQVQSTPWYGVRLENAAVF